MRIVVRLGSLEAELERTASGTTAPLRQQLDELFDTVASLQGEGALQGARTTFELAASFPSVSTDHPSAAVYLSHPIRIARRSLLLQEAPDHDTVAISLLHNAYEVFGLTEADLVVAGLSERVAGIVRTLTVDRAREHEPGYLESFYATIVAAGPLAALIRVVDRLDNLLAVATLDEAHGRSWYLETSEVHVVPIARRLSPALADYLQAVIDHQRRAGFDPVAKARLEEHEASG